MTEAVPVIELQNLQRVYRMGNHEVRALDGVDLRIDEGEFVAIVGPSGSGKSTLMYVLGCLDTPTGGHYRLAGQDVGTLDDAALSRLRNERIGFVFQQYHLLTELTVVENIALGLTYAGSEPGDRRQRAKSLAAGVGLAERLDHTALELSGGQMQRVAISRALAGRPSLILADEPTGNLDTRTGADIMSVLRHLHNEGHTIVLVTHDRNVAQQAERVITIVDGHIVSDEAGGLAQESDQNTGDKEVAHIPAPSAEVTALTDALASQATLQASAGIRWSDLFRMALREGLLAHKLRTALTMLGIVFGIAAVIAMTAITEGGKQQQLEQIRQIGLNNIQVRDLGLEGARLLRVRRIHPEGLSQLDVKEIQDHVTDIAAATAWKSLRAELRHADALVEDATILGLTGDFQDVVNYHVAEGRFLDLADESEFARVCVLGPGIADRLALQDAALGKVVIIGDQPFTVVGVMQRKAFASDALDELAIADRNQEVYLPLATLRQYFRKDPRGSELDAISLRMTKDDVLLTRAKEIDRIVSDLHRGAEDFAVDVPIEKLRQAQQTREVFNIIITVIAAISLVVGGIGIMNIMLATVTERTREIGIRRAIGASRRDIMRQFLLESLLMALAGGGIGILLGIAGGLVVEGGFGFAVAFNPAIISLAVAVSVLVGIVFGLYPAWLAAQKDPVEALRS